MKDYKLGEFKTEWEFQVFRTQHVEKTYWEKNKLSAHYRLIEMLNKGQWAPLVDLMIIEYEERQKGMWRQINHGVFIWNSPPTIKLKI